MNMESGERVLGLGVRASRPRGVALGRLENNLGYNLRLAQLRIFAAFADVAEPHGLTPSQFAVMLLIEANPGVMQTELADVLDVDRSTMVRLVDRCVEARLVRRGSSSVDRRASPPVLTARGRALLEKLEPVIVREETLASGLTRAERVTLLGLLKQIAGQAR